MVCSPLFQVFGERLLKVQLKETLSLEVTFVLPGAGTPRSEILIGVVKAGMDDLFVIGPPDLLFPAMERF